MGSTLTQTFKHYERELGKLSVTLVALGEQTGNLASAFTTLSNMLEEMNENMIKFKKAIAYPRNVMLAMMVAFVVMISYVVPKFKSIFDRLGADLPLPTQILLSLEHGLNNYGLYLLAGIIFFIFIFLWQMNSNYKFKYTVHALLLKTYLIKDIILFSSLHRFSLVFAELIHAGIPIIDALQSATELIENEVLKTKLTSIAKNVEQGSALHTSLKETGLFENMLIQMINAGEQSGQLDTMMKKVEHYLKMRFDAIISNLSQSIEPILLFFIAGMVILLALGIFLPMWDMGNAVKH
jgi:general secretion pathway protein F